MRLQIKSNEFCRDLYLHDDLMIWCMTEIYYTLCTPPILSFALTLIQLIGYCKETPAD